MSYWQDLRYVVWPIGLRAVLPAWAGVALGVLKDSALVSVLGYVELLAGIADPYHPDSGALLDPGHCRRRILLRALLSPFPGPRHGSKAEMAVNDRGSSDLQKSFGDSGGV